MPVRGHEVGETVRAVGRAYLLHGERRDADAERVADGTTEQGAAHTGTEILLLRPAPDGCGCCAHRTPSLDVERMPGAAL